MRFNLWRKVSSALAALLVTTALAFALVLPPQFAPRMYTEQQTHYLRFSVNFNSCVLVANTCSVKVGALPYNAFVVRAYQQVYTAFNSGTTDTLAVGTASGGGQLVAAQSVHAATAGLPLTVVAANLGSAATGNGIAATGTNGGFDVWAVYAQTGAAPTAGSAAIIIEYIAPNDGSCPTVSIIGGTGAGC
jgi:hypothetical protein